MNDTQSKPRRSTAPVIALVVTGNLGLVFVLLAVANFGPGWAAVAKWYNDGGYWMHPLTLLFLLQVVVGTAFGIVGVFVRLPLVLYLAVPALAFAFGLAGTGVGIKEAVEAVRSAPPEFQLPMWTASLALASSPTVFGALVAALGGASLALSAAAAAFVDRQQGPVCSPVAAIAATGMTFTVVLFALGWGVSSSSPFAQNPLALVAFGLLFLGALPVVALGTWGARRLSLAEGAADRSAGVSAAGALGVGLVVSTLALGRSFFTSGQAVALDVFATVPPAQKTVLLAAQAFNLLATILVTAVFVGAAVFIGITVVAATGSAMRDWLGRRLPWAGAAALVLLGCVWLDFFVSASMAERNQVLLAERSVRQLPEGLVLPTMSAADPFLRDGPVVTISGETVALDGVLLVEGLTEAGARLLAERLPPAHSEVRYDDSAAATRRRSAAVARPGASRSFVCSEARRAAFGLGLDHALAGPVRDRVHAWLRSAGTCRVQLLVTAPPPVDGQQAAGREQLKRLAIVGPIMAHAAAQPHHRVITLAASIPVPAASDPPRPDMLLTLDGGTATLSGRGGALRPVEATIEGGVDLQRVAARLREIHSAFEDEHRLYLYLRGDTKLQHLIDALAAMDGIFDDPVWVGTDVRPELPKPDPRIPSHVGGLIGAAGSQQ